MYINKPILDKVGGKVPTTWDELFDVADKMKAAGSLRSRMAAPPTMTASSSRASCSRWASTSTGRPSCEGDPAGLELAHHGQGVRVAAPFAEYFDDGIQGRAWNLAAAMVIEGKAGILFMGDWAKGSSPMPTRCPERTTSARRARAPRACSPSLPTPSSSSNSATSRLRWATGLGVADRDAGLSGKAALFKGAIPALTTASVASSTIAPRSPPPT